VGLRKGFLANDWLGDATTSEDTTINE